MKNLNIQKAQQGFTLIELMIVIAIIGILASLAIPAYQDYVTKSRVSESASISSGAKTAMALAFSEGTLTSSTDNASLGIEAAANITSKYVTSVTAAGTSSTAGTITVLVTGTNTVADDKNVIWTATCLSGAQCSWAVSSSNGMPSKFLPNP